MVDLNPNQFNTQQSILKQSNPDDKVTKTTGARTATSDVYEPSFSSDYNASPTPNPSLASSISNNEGADW